MRERINKSLNAFKQYSCLICNHTGNDILCKNCRESIKKPKYSCCICGQELIGSNKVFICRKCLHKPPPYEKLHYIGDYNDILSNIIIRAKIGKQPVAIATLLSLIKDFSEQYPNYGIDFADYHLLAMPTPRWRLLQRGFNLPAIFANTLAKYFHLPIIKQNVVTLPFFVKKQAKLSAKQRQKNKNLYQINDKLPNKIIIVDDVVTTGETITNLSKNLRKEKVKSIVIWAFARVNKKNQYD